jgi:hypothetical protein
MFGFQGKARFRFWRAKGFSGFSDTSKGHMARCKNTAEARDLVESIFGSDAWSDALLPSVGNDGYMYVLGYFYGLYTDQNPERNNTTSSAFILGWHDAQETDSMEEP